MTDCEPGGSGPERQVTVLIVTYQSRDTIAETIEALRPSYDAGLAAVVVVDNASSDGTADFVASNFRWVTLLQNSWNLGFGQGCNRGVRRATTPYLLLLNPDAVIALSSLQIMIGFMNNTARAGIAGPAVREQSGALQPAGGSPDPWTVLMRPLWPRWGSKKRRYVVPGELPQQTDWICGSVMLLRRSMLEQIGQFDSRFFLYFEETDLIRRAKKGGWEIWTVGTATATHVNASSAKTTQAPMMWGTLSEHYFRSRFYFMIKHFGWTMAVLSEVGELMTMAVRTMVDTLRGKRYRILRSRLQAPILKLPKGTVRNDKNTASHA